MKATKHTIKQAIPTMLMVLMVLPMLAIPISAEIIYEDKCYGNIHARESNYSIGDETIPLNNTVICEAGCDPVQRQCRATETTNYIYASIFIGFVFLVIGAVAKFG